MALRPEDEATLAICAPLLRKLKPPEGPFDPGKAWKHQYGLYSLNNPANRAPVGQVTLEHFPKSTDTSELSAVYDKTVQRQLHQIEETRCVYRFAAGLADPVSWNVKTSLTGSDAPAGLDGEKSFEVRGGRLACKTQNGARETAVAHPLTLLWLVYETVQRLSKIPDARFDFTLVDGGDKIKPGAHLALRSLAGLMLGQRSEGADVLYRKLERGAIYHPTLGKGGDEPGFPMRAWELTGRDLLPTTLWTDAQGRLLFAVSAMELLLWQT